MRWGLLVATLAGLAIAGFTIASAGLGPVLAAVGRIGWFGFAIFVLYTALPLSVLGLAWWTVTLGQPFAASPRFAWARTVREGATDVLPFSQFGGLVVGARVLTSAGVAAPRAWASMTADLSTELASQLVFTIYGAGALALALSGRADTRALWPVLGAGVGVTAAILAAFVAFQRPALRLAGGLAERVLPGAALATEGVMIELSAIYTQPRRVGAAFLLNLAAWVLSAAGAAIALRLIGSAAPLWAVLAIEALIFALRSAAFLLPGAYGVQEAAYALLGPLFGIDAPTALALSLLKRARDLTVGTPALLLWQAGEARRLARG